MPLTSDQLDLWESLGDATRNPQPPNERVSLEQVRNVTVHGFQYVCELDGLLPIPSDNDVREHAGWPLTDPNSPDPALRFDAESDHTRDGAPEP